MNNFAKNPNKLTWSHTLGLISILGINLLMFQNSAVAANPVRAAADHNIKKDLQGQRNPNATYDLCAYSQSDGMKNKNKFDTTKPVQENGEPGVADECPEPNSIEISIKVRDQVIMNKYAPAVGFRKKAKPAPDNNAPVISNVLSLTGTATGSATQIVTPPAVLLQTNASALAKGEEAAAEAIDPFSVDMGTYDYGFSINSLELQTGDLGDFAGVTFFASDSRFIDPLWKLEIAVDKLITSANDLQIRFDTVDGKVIDGEVVDVFLNLSPGQISTIENNVRSAFEMQGGIARLQNFNIFEFDGNPDTLDVKYVVDREITFAEGGRVGVAKAIPESNSVLGLLAIGTLGIGSLLKRNKRQ